MATSQHKKPICRLHNRVKAVSKRERNAEQKKMKETDRAKALLYYVVALT